MNGSQDRIRDGMYERHAKSRDEQPTGHQSAEHANVESEYKTQDVNRKAHINNNAVVRQSPKHCHRVSVRDRQ